MIKKAIEQARDALTQCENCLEEIRAATTKTDTGVNRNLKVIDVAWSKFLHNSNRFFAKLEQGAKNCAESRVWFNELKQKRKKDELLQYLHQARHAEEHTLQTSALDSSGFTQIPPLGDATFMKLPDVGTRKNRMLIHGGSKGVSVILPNKVVGPVLNRGRKYEIPREHQSINIEDHSAENLISIALPTLVGILEQAEQFPTE